MQNKATVLNKGNDDIRNIWLNICHRNSISKSKVKKNHNTSFTSTFRAFPRGIIFTYQIN